MMVEGYKRREDHNLRRLALLVSTINAVHVKHPKSADWYYKMWTITPQQQQKELYETSVRPKLARQRLRLVKKGAKA